MIDQYCERLGPGLWQEPINAATNIGFFIAALAAYLYATRVSNRPVDGGILSLILLLVLIGIGSTLFHTFASKWAELADSIPILTFVTAYLALYLWHLVKRRIYLIVLFLIAFHVTNALALLTLPKDVLNGSLFYLPSWISLLAITLFASNARLRAQFLKATLIFTFSITLRSIDNAVCDTIPVGTHFLWHLINAALLYLLIRIMIQNTTLPVPDSQNHAR